MSTGTEPPPADSEDGQPAETPEPNLSRNDCFDLLSNHRRRYALHYLQYNGEEASLGELADQIAAWENDIDMETVSYDQRKRVYTSLQQVHLPRMDSLDVVEFDDREGCVELGPAAEDLDIYLEVVQGNDVPWSVYYTGLALFDAALVGVVAAGVPPFAALAPTAVTVFVVTTFLLTAVAHLYFTRTEMRLGRTQEPPGKPESQTDEE